MKRVTLLILSLFLISNAFSSELKQKFVKGNIQDKIETLQEATGEDFIWISNKALDFVLENAELLNDDRDFETLASYCIYSLKTENIEGKTEFQKQQLSNKLIKIYNNFPNSSTVQIAVLSRFNLFQNQLPVKQLTSQLNQFLSSPNSISSNPDLLKEVINLLGFIGDNNSFKTLYNLSENTFKNYKTQISVSLTRLIPLSMNEINSIILSQDLYQINRIYELISFIPKDVNISSNYICEIAENLLNKSIVLLGNNTTDKKLVINIQLNSLKVLTDNKCTRASKSVVAYFDKAINEFDQELITQEEFISIIDSLAIIAPIDSVEPLINYLKLLNSNIEKEKAVQLPVVISVINTLGAIGDKSAFDSLLAVTYLSYPDSVLSAARNALSGLKW